MAFSRLWSLILLALYLVYPHFEGKWRIASAKNGWLLVLFVALVARLLPAAALPVGAGYDTGSYQIVAGLLLEGRDVYSAPEAENRHPYLPFQMYWMAASQWFADEFHISFNKTVKLQPILADVAIALVLYVLLSRKYGLRKAFHGGMIYALNPVTVYICAYHGQFDSLPALFILLSLLSLNGSPALAGGLLGIGILSKSWPILALPSLINGISGSKPRILFLAACLFVPLAGVVIYTAWIGANPVTILQRTTSYNWGIGVWGYSYLARLASLLIPRLEWLRPELVEGLFRWLAEYSRYLTLAGLILVWWFKARKEDAANSILTILVAFFAITHAFSIQYLMWVVPFAVLNLEYRWLKRYTIAAFVYMFLVYNTFILEMLIDRILPWPQADWFIIMPTGLLVWLVCVGWLLDRILPPESKIMRKLRNSGDHPVPAQVDMP